MNRVFTEILDDIKNNGVEAQPRDLKVREAMVRTYEIDPLYPIADFESRPFNWKYFAGELCWYMMKDVDIDYISQFSGFWKNITNPNSDEVNSNYGSILFGEQIEWVVDSLLKDPNSRQAVAFLNRPLYQWEGNKDFVCTMYLNFWIRDNTLNMKVQMRSNDVFYGLTYDAPFFSFVMQHVLHELGGKYKYIQLGKIYHCVDNIHYYEKHFELADKISNELNLESEHMLKLRLPFFQWNNGEGDLKWQMWPHGRNFIKDVDELLEKDGTQEDYKKLVKNYFRNW